MMIRLCKRRPCRREAVGAIVLHVGAAGLRVEPWQDPADVIESYAVQHREEMLQLWPKGALAGHAAASSAAEALALWMEKSFDRVCRERRCGRRLDSADHAARPEERQAELAPHEASLSSESTPGAAAGIGAVGSATLAPAIVAVGTKIANERQSFPRTRQPPHWHAMLNAAMHDRGVSNWGDGTRLDTFLGKLDRGEAVTVAFIGGSVSTGRGSSREGMCGLQPSLCGRGWSSSGFAGAIAGWIFATWPAEDFWARCSAAPPSRHCNSLAHTAVVLHQAQPRPQAAEWSGAGGRGAVFFDVCRRADLPGCRYCPEPRPSSQPAPAPI